MKFMTVIFLLISCQFLSAQSKQQETKVDCVAHWKKGEEKTYLLIRNKSKIVSGNPEKSEAAIKVVEDFFKNFNASDKMRAEDMRKELSSFKIEDKSEYSIVRSTGWLKEYVVTRRISTGDGGQVETYKMTLRDNLLYKK